MRNAVPQVAQVRSIDCAARRHARLQNFWRLLGGAGKSIRQCWHVSRCRPADFLSRPTSSTGRLAHPRHRGEGLSTLTSSTLPQSGQGRRRVARFFFCPGSATAPSVPGTSIAIDARGMRVPVGERSASTGWIPLAFGLRGPDWTPRGVQWPPGVSSFKGLILRCFRRVQTAPASGWLPKNPALSLAMRRASPASIRIPPGRNRKSVG